MHLTPNRGWRCVGLRLRPWLNLTSILVEAGGLRKGGGTRGGIFDDGVSAGDLFRGRGCPSLFGVFDLPSACLTRAARRHVRDHPPDRLLACSHEPEPAQDGERRLVVGRDGRY